MKHCIYCGYTIDFDTKHCPNCHEEIPNDEEEKKVFINVKCIKCNSKNINYQIKRYNKNGIVYEEEEYICQDCGRKFNDRNRLGSSFNNTFQLILSSGQKKVCKWIFAITFSIIAVGLYNSNKDTKRLEEINNWQLLDCNGLTTVSIDKINDDSWDNTDEAKKNYVKRPFSFSGTVHEVSFDRLDPYIVIYGEDSGARFYLNPKEVEKAKLYNVGDNIKVCGVVKKVGAYSRTVVDNVSIK